MTCQVERSWICGVARLGSSVNCVIGWLIMCGGWLLPPKLTVMITSSLLRNCESSAVNRSVYVPGAVNVAVVLKALGSPNRTAPGPEASDHVVLSTLPAGMPSSLAVPARFTMFRSEEHTSELQSRGLISYAVFCLKKK